MVMVVGLVETKKNNEMLNDHEIKYEIEKLKRWSYWLCIRVCELEKLEGIEDNEEEDNKEEEDVKPPKPPNPPYEEEEEGEIIDNDIYDIICTDKYVAVGHKGAYVSEDGVEWKHINIPNFEYNYSITIAYGNNTYIVSTDTDKIYYSSDAINWGVSNVYIQRYYHIPEECSLQIGMVKFWKDKFIGLPRITDYEHTDLPIWSDDGITWMECAVVDYEGFGWFSAWDELIYNDEYIVAIGTFGHQVIYSEDGITWAAPSKGPSLNGTPCITYGDNKFVIGCDHDGDMSKAKHPDNWESIYSFGFVAILAYTGDRFVGWLSGWNTGFHSASPEWLVWEEDEMVAEKGINISQFGGKPFEWIVKDVAVGREYIAKYDGEKWYIKYFDSEPHNLKYLNGKYYICGNNLLVSEDGENWKKLRYIDI